MSYTIGIDFGNTIVYNDKSHHLKKAFPHALKVIKKLAARYPVHIVSRVDARQKIEVKRWMKDNNFFVKTGIPEANVHFCSERHQKGGICFILQITHFIDDRPEVVAHLDDEVNAYLFRPNMNDYVKFGDIMATKKVAIVHHWKDIEKVFFDED